jgi:hypothetical protein
MFRKNTLLFFLSVKGSDWISMLHELHHTWRHKAPCSNKMAELTHPMMQHQVPENRNTQPHHLYTNAPIFSKLLATTISTQNPCQNSINYCLILCSVLLISCFYITGLWRYVHQHICKVKTTAGCMTAVSNQFHSTGYTNTPNVNTHYITHQYLNCYNCCHDIHAYTSLVKVILK